MSPRRKAKTAKEKQTVEAADVGSVEEVVGSVEEVVETVVETVEDADAVAEPEAVPEPTVAPAEPADLNTDTMPEDWLGGDSIGFRNSGLTYNLDGLVFWTDDVRVVRLVDNRYEPKPWPGKGSAGKSRAINGHEIAKREGWEIPVSDAEAARFIMEEAAWLKAAILAIEAEDEE